jgi:hypothetical protein
VATKFALLLRRRSTLLLALSVIAAIAGSAHGIGHGHWGLWDGPL